MVPCPFTSISEFSAFLILQTLHLQDFCRRTISVPGVIPDDDDDEDFDDDDEDEFVHPSKLFQFLVGSKSKHELLAIGGSWSLKEDGPNPDSDPKTLINTAIR